MDNLNDYVPCLMLTIFVVLVSAISMVCFYFKSFSERLILHPYLIFRGTEGYRLITAGFIHNSPFHLFLNLFIIFTIGLEVSRIAGQLLFTMVSFCSILAGNILSTFMNQNDFSFTSAGASASAFGLIGAYCILDKSSGSLCLPLIGYVSGFYLLSFIVIVQIVLIRLNLFKTVDHFSHLGGLASGAVFAYILN